MRRYSGARKCKAQALQCKNQACKACLCFDLSAFNQCIWFAGLGQFEQIVAGTWAGMPPNIKGFIPRLLKIAAALKLLEAHYAMRAEWEEDGDSVAEARGAQWRVRVFLYFGTKEFLDKMVFGTSGVRPISRP